MGFWLFMLLVSLLIPFTMLGFGSLFAKGTPKERNMAFGYRSARSMRNEETWVFAHRHCGRLWRRMGLVLLLLSLAARLPMTGRDAETLGIYACVLCLVQILPLLGSIFFTEAALKRRFDEQGRRRDGN